MIVLHYTGMQTAQDALARLCDPDSKVSAHYMIEEDGTCHALVPEDKRAWHAGVSYWQGETDINSRAIGIEIVNGGHDFGYTPFPEAQIQAVMRLCQDIMARYSISPERVLGHSDVAPARKIDPGHLFPWERLAKAGVGVWPERFDGEILGEGGVDDFYQGLLALGYDPKASREDVVVAFHRHFCPERFLGWADRPHTPDKMSVVCLRDLQNTVVKI